VTNSWCFFDDIVDIERIGRVDPVLCGMLSMIAAMDDTHHHHPPFLVVLALFKEEGHIMAEWMEHYRWQGVNHFIMIDNGSSKEDAAA
jgi:hypothetical protein